MICPILSMLLAAAAADAGYNCVDADEGEAWTYADLSSSTVNSIDLCLASCESTIGDDETRDYCCAAEVKPPNRVLCSLYTADAAALDIKQYVQDTNGFTYEAWAWEAGISSNDLNEMTEDEGDDEDTSLESE